MFRIIYIYIYIYIYIFEFGSIIDHWFGMMGLGMVKDKGHKKKQNGCDKSCNGAAINWEI